MNDTTQPKRWRKPLIYTLVVVLGAAIGAASVFFVGSSNRKADRNAVLAYERAILPLVREAGRVVQQEMKPILEEIDDGDVTDEQLVQRAAAWERVFERIRLELLALDPPELLGSIEDGWSASMGAYLLTVDAIADIAGTAPDQRVRAIETAATFGERADDFFDDVAAIIQFHRKRLGLGPSQNLPDPSPSPTS